MSKLPPFLEKQVFEFSYPFFHEEVELFDGESTYKTLSWRPGVRHELTAYGDPLAVADGVGSQIVTVVSVHKPGKFPERVFFTRQWKNPEGKVFGKTKLRVKTSPDFRKLVAGYGFKFEVTQDQTLSV
ncbi:hypothetical protein [Zavarzinella formosa]|uniref:hypothetical protein n=1 Tax=Zavarzinella formosa TaxID=360055 RepID=UPI000374D24E|nr:hypothetical protein [Zavarzinella formosa]